MFNQINKIFFLLFASVLFAVAADSTDCNVAACSECDKMSASMDMESCCEEENLHNLCEYCVDSGKRLLGLVTCLAGISAQDGDGDQPMERPIERRGKSGKGKGQKRSGKSGKRTGSKRRGKSGKRGGSKRRGKYGK